MTKAEIRKELNSFINGLNGREISAGVYVKTIGYKYLTLVNTWGATTAEKIPLEYFDGVTMGEGVDQYHYDIRG